jgi:antagonist of KipI
MAIRVVKAGLLDTIQDTGRYGFQHWGINPGGAMDRTAMQLANMLVGNEQDEAVIEMHFPAAELLFEEPALIALAGADFNAIIDGEHIPPHQPVLVAKDAALSFTRHNSGARVYLAVRGGFIVNHWLGSCSTNLKVKAGGKDGKALQKNDQLLLKHNDAITTNQSVRLPWQADTKDLYTGNRFYFIPGNEYALLNDAAKTQLESASFILGRQYDRMGFRLQGAGLQYNIPKEQISTAVTKGTMQLLPDGQLIILMADHQTTGGYPRIGHVISAHIDSLSQLLPGAELFFEQTTMAKAEELLFQQQRNLHQLQNACNFRLAQWLKKQRLN